MCCVSHASTAAADRVFPTGGPAVRTIRLPKFEGLWRPRTRMLGTQRYGRAKSPTSFCVSSVGQVSSQEDTLRKGSE